MLFIVPINSANIVYTSSPNSHTATITWTGTPPASVPFTIQWSFASFGGNWQLSQAPTFIPFNAVCNSCLTEDFLLTANGSSGPLAVCQGTNLDLCFESDILKPNTQVTWQVSTNGGASYSNIATNVVPLTFNPTANWLGYMNVFNLPSQGGGYVFGSPWGTNDLVATISGNELCLQPNRIGDPNPFWYTPSGGPGSTGNKIMEANHYIENTTGTFAGQTISYSVEVTSNSFSCGHTTRLYIREFAPDFHL